MTGIKKAAVLPEPESVSDEPMCICLLLTSLSSGDDVVALQHRRDGVGLDGSRVDIGTLVDVLDHDGV